MAEDSLESKFPNAERRSAPRLPARDNSKVPVVPTGAFRHLTQGIDPKSPHIVPPNVQKMPEPILPETPLETVRTVQKTPMNSPSQFTASFNPNPNTSVVVEESEEIKIAPEIWTGMTAIVDETITDLVMEIITMAANSVSSDDPIEFLAILDNLLLTELKAFESIRNNASAYFTASQRSAAAALARGAFVNAWGNVSVHNPYWKPIQ